MSDSIEFSWDPAEFDLLLRSCNRDEGLSLSLRYLEDRTLTILEAGCGSGRVVKFLSDMGYRNVCGVELNAAAVGTLRKAFPELNVVAGNLLHMPFPEASFDRVLCYGVIEHFPKGVEEPLRSLHRALKPGGIAIVTVPSFNKIRQLQAVAEQVGRMVAPRRNPLLRKLFKQPPLERVDRSWQRYHVYPSEGPFFEYRLKPAQFEAACRKEGFDIVESVPISHLDGLFHLFGPRLVRFENWQFDVSRRGAVINAVLKAFPFVHNHMHACVLRKGG